MAKQSTTDLRHDEGPGLRLPAPVVRRHTAPQPGGRLRTAVDAALAELTAVAVPDEEIRRHLDGLLLGGLACTAATGDTCRIEPAVAAVRTARAGLAAADPDETRSALRFAHDALAPTRPAAD